MLELLKKLCTVEDRRQEKKVQQKMSDIIAIVLFASLANANEWMEIYYFAKEHEAYLRKYLTLRNGIPSHDTIQRVFAMVSPEFLQQIQTQWNEMLAKENYGFKKVERLPGNIGYIDFTNFASPKYSKETVTAVMKFVENCDALIFDLRQNGGGDPVKVRLAHVDHLQQSALGGLLAVEVLG